MTTDRFTSSTSTDIDPEDSMAALVESFLPPELRHMGQPVPLATATDDDIITTYRPFHTALRVLVQS